MIFKPHVIVALLALFSASSWAKTELTNLIEQALTVDSQRQQILAQSQAIREAGVASSTLADPKLKLGVGGLPTDSFALDEDPMTNLSVGLMQEFGRGSTLKLQQKMANQQADGTAFLIKNRELELANAMTQQWAELVYQQQASAVLQQQQTLIKELIAFMHSSYASGRSESQALLQAQVQLAKMADQVQKNQQQQGRIKAQLSEWLGNQWLIEQAAAPVKAQFDWFRLTQILPAKSSDEMSFYRLLRSHPMVQAASANIASNQVQVEIANESYAPKFGVEVMYAYRQANGMNGQPASDLLSAYLTMDLPLFTDKRQDRQYAAAQYKVGAAKSQRDVLLQQMNAKLNVLLIDKTNLEQRLDRYRQSLLMQAGARTQAVERGYKNNSAQLSEVLSAMQDELALSLEQQRLSADLNIVRSNLAYLLNAFDYQVAAPNLAANSLVSTQSALTQAAN